MSSRLLTAFAKARLGLVALAAALFTACGAPPGRTPAAADTGVPFDAVYHATWSCHGDERDATVIHDAATWAAWWATTTCRSPSPPPRVDFSSRVVLAVRDLAGPTSCYDVAVARIDPLSSGGYRVVVAHEVPAATTGCVVRVVRPVQAVAVAKPRGLVDFEWRTAEAPPSPP